MPQIDTMMSSHTHSAQTLHPPPIRYSPAAGGIKEIYLLKIVKLINSIGWLVSDNLLLGEA